MWYVNVWRAKDEPDEEEENGATVTHHWYEVVETNEEAEAVARFIRETHSGEAAQLVYRPE